MAHFDIPLDLPHAGRIADRILTLLEAHAEERGVAAPELLDVADRLTNVLYRFTDSDENPSPAESAIVVEEAATLARQLVERMEADQLTGDRLGQLIRNLFECLELGEEGAEISLRAGENPHSLQRPC